MLIVMTGLPGSGKSTIAEAVGRELGIPVFAKDWLEATLTRSQLSPHPDTPHKTVGYVAYDLLTTLAERQLQAGQSAILDSVASIASVREAWRTLAHHYHAAWRVIECICPDEILHQAWLEGRQRGIPGWHELTWAEVERVRGYYAPWTEPHLIVDTTLPLAYNLEQVLMYIQAKGEPHDRDTP
jgi:predicted kinase